MNTPTEYIIGIDEVGRGPLAGPVCVAAVAMPISYEKELKRELIPVRDSKKMPQHKREAILADLKKYKNAGDVKFTVSFTGPRVIDQKGIQFAVRRAISSAIRRLRLDPAQCRVVLDGGLHAPRAYTNQQTIIRGDESEFVVSLASIVAKVTRDKKMVRLSKHYPEYKFEEHKGYGTEHHRKTIKKLGSLPVHRKSFLKNIH